MSFALPRTDVHLPRAALLMLVGLIAACAEGSGVMRTYTGPKRPDADIAKVGGTFVFYGLGAHTVTLHEIDGTRVTEGDLEVLPGTHTVSVKYESAVATTAWHGISLCYVTFQADAGHTYIANGDASSESWRCWIEDKQTQQRISGTFARPQAWGAAAGVDT